MKISELRRLFDSSWNYKPIVRIHPAHDWFMQGVTYVEITSFGKGFVHLYDKWTKSKRKISFDYLLDSDGNLFEID